MTNHPIEPHPVLAKVARALAESDARRFGVDAKSVAAWVQMQQSNYLPDARAALESLRELPGDVKRAGLSGTKGYPVDPAAVFTAMINTIIGESA